MDEYLIVFTSLHTSSCPKPIHKQTRPILPIILIFFFFFFFFFSISLLCFLLVSFYKKLKRRQQNVNESNTHQTNKPHSLFLDIINSNSPNKLDFHIVGNTEEGNNDRPVGEDCGKSGKKKNKKKRGKKKRRTSQSDDGGGGEDMSIDKQCVDSLYPFTSSSSATQRKIKQQYDQLVQSNASKGLTVAQVGKFVNCLVETRNDLQNKSEIIHRKFTITKALLMKADRSSFDRLSQQLYKLEAEQKRLEEDTTVYNRLQQQLKLSPAYKKMLEIGARMELRASEHQFIKETDSDLPDISFEELLAQEKKDTFWQKNGKMRSCMT